VPWTQGKRPREKKKREEFKPSPVLRVVRLYTAANISWVLATYYPRAAAASGADRYQGHKIQLLFVRRSCQLAAASFALMLLNCPILKHIFARAGLWAHWKPPLHGMHHSGMVCTYRAIRVASSQERTGSWGTGDARDLCGSCMGAARGCAPTRAGSRHKGGNLVCVFERRKRAECWSL
jgi:hypothetical protein